MDGKVVEVMEASEGVVDDPHQAARGFEYTLPVYLRQFEDFLKVTERIWISRAKVSIDKIL